MLLGAIDVGTNSIHLIVVELDPHYGTARTLLKTREMVRLGAGDALARGYLGKKAVARGVAAIARFADAARAAGASDVRAVATSAVREASNRDEFVAAVRAASGVTLEVLDDVEEARLIHLGVSRGFALDGRLACIFDIGGGSTELIIGDAARSYYLHSVRLGSLRLFERYLADGASGGYPALEQHVRKEIAPVATALREYGFDVLVGTSGTLMGLAALDAADAGLALQRVHGYVLRVERLRALQRTMLRLSPADRRRLPGMNPRRCDIIVAGNAIAIALAEAVERDEIVVSERALREGLVVDYLERNLALARTLGDERTRRFDTAHALARRFDGNGVHENHVGTLALQIFDGLAELHRFEPADRDLLFAAALVHDVGRTIAASAHHKHGAYIVRSALLPGWRPEEIELIAALVRYHRKSLPKLTHPEWANASPLVRAKIEGLAAMLRVADGLDRRHVGAVDSLDMRIDASEVLVRVHALGEIGPELDGARYKAEMLEGAFGRRLMFEHVWAADEAVGLAQAAG